MTEAEPDAITRALEATDGFGSADLDDLIRQLEGRRHQVRNHELMSLKCMGLTECPKCKGAIRRIDHVGMISVWCQNQTCLHTWEEAGAHAMPQLGW